MRVSGNAIRVGNIIRHQSKLWAVTKTQHVQPGKGGAYMQVEMKSLAEGTKTHERFRSSEQVERVFLEEAPYQFLYPEGDNLVFMNQENFEQITLPKDFLGDSRVFLKEGMVVNVSMHDGTPVTIQLPDTVILTIEEADPVVKGQTAASSYKPALLDNGIRIMVPPHIETGMRVVVHTSDQTYVERAKE